MKFEQLGHVRGVYTPLRTEAGLVASSDVLDARENPRRSFDEHTADTHWDHHELIYFAGYAFWYYFNLPFCLSLPGVQIQEPMRQDPELADDFRTLQITFPQNFVTHSSIQKLDFDREYRLRRMTYSVDVLFGRTASHWCYDHREFDRIQMPTFRFANMAPLGFPHLNAFVIQVLDVSTKHY